MFNNMKLFYSTLHSTQKWHMQNISTLTQYRTKWKHKMDGRAMQLPS